MELPGRKIHYQWQKGWITIEEDPTKRKYAIIKTNYHSKNVEANPCHISKSTGPTRSYDFEDTSKCPINVQEMYVFET